MGRLVHPGKGMVWVKMVTRTDGSNREVPSDVCAFVVMAKSGHRIWTAARSLVRTHTLRLFFGFAAIPP